ncbi:MAG TPA: hypothetical protein VMT54_11005 [Candidatus Cybelea sp.]|nr:hypothetical protein [Candidatus Cybelea sp.]
MRGHAGNAKRLCCMQAKHDAIDSIVMHLHEKVDQITERYTPRIIAMYVKDFEGFQTAITEVDRAIIASREERHNRSELYNRITREHLPLLMNVLGQIQRAETVIVEAIEEERNLKRTKRRSTVR